MLYVVAGAYFDQVTIDGRVVSDAVEGSGYRPEVATCCSHIDCLGVGSTQCSQARVRAILRSSALQNAVVGAYCPTVQLGGSDSGGKFGVVANAVGCARKYGIVYFHRIAAAGGVVP